MGHVYDWATMIGSFRLMKGGSVAANLDPNADFGRLGKSPKLNSRFFAHP